MQRRPRRRLAKAWRFSCLERAVALGLIVTATLMPLGLYQLLPSSARRKKTTTSTATNQDQSSSFSSSLQKQQHRGDDDDDDDDEHHAKKMVLMKRLYQAAETTLNDIRLFFYGEERALLDGFTLYSNHQKTNNNTSNSNGGMSRLATRWAARLRQCLRTTTADDDPVCIFTIVFLGSAQQSGRDVFWNQSYPFVTEQRLQQMLLAFLLPSEETLTLTRMQYRIRFKVWKHAMDHDLSREGAQTNHLCLDNLIGKAVVDVVVWDFDAVGQKRVQLEAFTRWLLRRRPSPPALLLVNNQYNNVGGPHGQSRRGVKRNIALISPGHMAVEYVDHDPNEAASSELPLLRVEPYRNSTAWQQLWNSTAPTNAFWLEFFDHYTSHIDFGAMDSYGAIWHLDHLEDFGNAALDRDKALPLFDCGPEHDPPCQQIPAPMQRKLEAQNRTDLLQSWDTSGQFCSVRFGCRHSWYGGTRSHEIRGELHAWPLLQAFHDAVWLVINNEDTNNDATTGHDNGFLNQNKDEPTLPKPLHCSPRLCENLRPRCLTSYEPNVGPKLGDHLIKPTAAMTANNSRALLRLPPLGVSHYANDRKFALRNLESRMAPLGYIDRKFGYQLSPRRKKNDAANNKESTKEQTARDDDDEAVEQARIAFSSHAEKGPLILCEPPCFVDECPKKRKMPLLDYAKIVVDGKEIPIPEKEGQRHPSIEVGKNCGVVMNDLPAGNHILELSLTAKVSAPREFVMFSHVISFDRTR